MPNLASRSRAHGLAPGLGAEAAVAQREPAQVDAHAVRDLGDVERIGRRRAQDARAEILHQHHLPLGGAAGDRHGGQAEPLGAVVESEPAGEQPVAEGVVEDVAGLGAHAGERARHQVRPQVEIGPGVADDGRLAGRSRGGVQPQQLLARHREQAERVIVAQVGFDRERKARDVGERLEMRPGRTPAASSLRRIRRNLGVGARDRLLQATKLQRREIAARHGLGGAIEHEGRRRREPCPPLAFTPTVRRSARPWP